MLCCFWLLHAVAAAASAAGGDDRSGNSEADLFELIVLTHHDSQV